MIVTNKILKLFIRYAKDNDKYNALKNYINITNIKDEKKLIFLCPHNMEIFAGYLLNERYEKFINFISEIYHDEIIEIFNNFLQEKNINKIFVKNINITFIEHIAAKKLTKEKNKFNALINNVPPTEFIMFAFHWPITKEGYEFWNNIHFEWIKYLNDKLKIILN